VPAQTVMNETRQAIKQLRKQYRVKGFRPGKAPENVIKRLFAPQIEQDVTQKLMNEALPQALTESGVKLISQPTLEDSSFEDGQPFRFTTSFEVKPEFQVTGYMGLELSRENYVVSDDMVDAKLEELRQSLATAKSLDDPRPLKKGDLAVIDYQAFIDDQPLEGGANPNYQLEVGAGRFHLLFEEGLIGLNKDDETEINVHFENDHFNPKLAGQDVRFKIKILDIKEKILSALNDDFAKDIGRQDIETLEELRNKIREDLDRAESRRIDSMLQEQINEKLLTLTDFDVPELLVNRELEAMVSNMLFNLKRSGINPETIGLSEEKMREDYRAEAIKRVRIALIFEKIGEDLGLEVTDSDLDEKIMEVARSVGQTPEDVRDMYNKNNLIDELKEGIVTEKTLKYIIDNANIVSVDPTVPALEGEVNIPDAASTDQI
jgi:trigger factor